MNFNKHSDLGDNAHSFLSGSRYHWIHYTPEKLELSFRKYQAVQRGTELHDFAERCVRLKIRLPKNRNSLNMFVNDAIAYKMTPEQPLYFSRNAFGTADAISFRESLLRIHDLKTGLIPASFHQLEVYTSYFCLEYDIFPNQIAIELRIYQGKEVKTLCPEPGVIFEIMDKVKRFDKLIEKIREQEE